MADLDPRRQEVVDQVRALWPYLESHDRCEWVHVCMPWFSGDFVATLEALSGQDVYYGLTVTLNRG